MLQLVSVKGGAKLIQKSVSFGSLFLQMTTRMEYLSVFRSSVRTYWAEPSRLLQINVTRFLRAHLEMWLLDIEYHLTPRRNLLLQKMQRGKVVRDGTRYKVDSVPVQGQVCSISFVFPVIPKRCLQENAC